MKKRFFLWIASALLLFAGCTNDDIVNEQPTPNVEGGKIVLTASIPDESPQTKVNLTPETGTKNIIITWRVGDQAKFFFKQNTTIVEGALVTLTTGDITMEGRQAAFTVVIPEGINEQATYTVYMTHGAESKLVEGQILINVTPSRLMPMADLHDVPVAGSVEVAGGASVGDIPLQHLGTLQCVTIQNSSAEELSFTSPSIYLSDWNASQYYYDKDYYYVPYYNLISGEVEDIEEEYSSPAETPITVAPNATVLLAQWIKPLPDTPASKIRLEISVQPYGPEISSQNRKPARNSVMQTGRAYHLYALWDGDRLCFTDDTFTSPFSPLVGDLMHADGKDVIAVVYSKGDGKVYYNSMQDIDIWLGETPLGTGAEARVVIDNNNHPHVVFTTDDGRIAYRKHNGTEWSDPIYIESKFGGSCSKPDIDVDYEDYSCYAHITYTDTRGENNNHHTNFPDIMYAENRTSNGGAFERNLIYDGYIDDDGQGSRTTYRYDKGSFIAVYGEKYILTHQYHQNINGQAEDNQYRVVIKTASGTEGGTTSSPTDKEDVFDLKNTGYGFYALCKYNNANYKASISVGGDTPVFYPGYPYTHHLSDGDFAVPHNLSRSGDVAGLAGSNIYYHISGQYDNVYPDVMVKDNTRVVPVDKDDDPLTYIIYTDGSDSKIKVLPFQPGPLT
ncbi:MAG: hypothetical protein QM237_05125 [Bacteroidota bacterium]|jgi:hypothetical protein|nr:hypothetical protein [Bacteroidota bacterium]HHU95706.1 hypothetical protein [Petrimonas sp.]